MMKILLTTTIIHVAFGALVSNERYPYTPRIPSALSSLFKGFDITPIYLKPETRLYPTDIGRNHPEELLQKSMGMTSGIIKRLSLTFNQDKPDPREEECKSLGGTFVDPECFQYSSKQEKFDDCRATCKAKKGDIWTPNPNDTFLFYKLGFLMPEFARSKTEKVWIGYRTLASASVVQTVHGEDISTSYLANVQDMDLMANKCMTLNFPFGGFYTASQDCTTNDIECICEFPLSPVVHHPTVHPFQHFKNIFQG